MDTLNNKLVQVAVFDFDGTCIDGQSGALFTAYLVRRRLMGIPRGLRLLWWGARYKLHLPYRQNESRELVFGSLVGLKPSDVEEVLRSFYYEVLEPRYRAQALRAIEGHVQNGDVTLLVSATFETIAQEAASSLGMTTAIATQMERDPRGFYTGRVSGPVIAGDEKYRAVQRWCDERFGKGSWNLGWAYADHYTDKDLLSHADHACVVCPGKTLKPEAKREGWEICDWA